MNTARAAGRLLLHAERSLEAWVRARGEAPTDGTREGFRLLALHHQGAHGVPSFNACRETCREIAYHYNLLSLDSRLRGNDEVSPGDRNRTLKNMVMLARHLQLFVDGKLQVAGLGEFCCASRPLRKEERPDA